MCSAHGVGANGSRIYTFPRGATELRKVSAFTAGFMCGDIPNTFASFTRDWATGGAQ